MNADDKRTMRREMALAARDLLGTGYITPYYFDAAADFVTVAEYYVDEAVKAAVSQAVKDERRRQRQTRLRTRYRFTGRYNGRYEWESTTSTTGDSRHEQVGVSVRRFWGREYPFPTSDDAVSPTNDRNPTQAVGNGGPIGERATSGRTEGVS